MFARKRCCRTGYRHGSAGSDSHPFERQNGCRAVLNFVHVHSESVLLMLVDVALAGIGGVALMQAVSLSHTNTHTHTHTHTHTSIISYTKIGPEACPKHRWCCDCIHPKNASQERLTQGTVTSTMRREAHPSGCARCGAGAGCSAVQYQSLSRAPGSACPGCHFARTPSRAAPALSATPSFPCPPASCIIKSVRSRTSFISSPLWTP